MIHKDKINSLNRGAFMKIVIVGLGKVGRALTQQLTADRHDIVVIDRKPDLVEEDRKSVV